MRRDPSTPAATASAESTLFCIPHAGGSAAYYTDFRAHVPGHIRLQPLELAGRGRRCREPAATSMEAMAQDLWTTVSPVAQRAPYALFGHSMGALLAFLCAVRAFESGARLPEALFLSACPPPGDWCVPLVDGRPAITRDEVWRHAVALGGIPEDIVRSPDFRQYLEPILHADFTAMRTWSPRDLPTIPVPIVVLLGNQDRVTSEKARNWDRLTSGGVEIHSFDGGHFFLKDHGRELGALIARRLGFSA